MSNRFRQWLRPALVLCVALPGVVRGQGHVHVAPPQPAQQAMSAAQHAMHSPDPIARLHMEMTPGRPATKADSARAWAVVKELRAAIGKYRDTSAAVAAGYKLFAPQLKTQHTYHFTRNLNAIQALFTFDPAKPTSLLYEKDARGALQLVGAMYTMPRGVRVSRLDGRIPTSLTSWHKHVNWCVPRKDQQARWIEQRDGRPVFGPESPIVTRAACERVGGEFRDNVFGWMVHVNVFAGEDLGAIFGDHHITPR